MILPVWLVPLITVLLFTAAGFFLQASLEAFNKPHIAITVLRIASAVDGIVAAALSLASVVLAVCNP